MARQKSIRIRSNLKGMISGQMLSRLARKSGFVKRQRKVDPVKFFWTVVLGFSTGQKRQIAGLRRAYYASTGTSLVPASFYDRFTPTLKTYLKLAYDHVIEKVSPPAQALHGKLNGFKDLLLIDTTVIRLHEVLNKVYPACRTNHTKAAAKLHMVMSVIGKGPHTVKITSERTHDSKKFRIGPWCRDRLLVFDLGYYNYGLFTRINANNGYFLSRLKSNANPKITAIHNASNSKNLIGKQLQDVLPRLRRSVLDAEMEFVFYRRISRNVRRRVHVRFRVVGLRDAKTGEYHLYVTNLPVDKITGVDVADIYRVRWGIELIFKYLKSSFRLEDISSRKKHIVETLIYASLLTLIVSRVLFHAIRNKIRKEQHRIKEGRWVNLFNSYASKILMIINSPPRYAKYLSRYIEPLIFKEIIDPHKCRPGLLDQIQNRTSFAKA